MGREVGEWTCGWIGGWWVGTDARGGSEEMIF